MNRREFASGALVAPIAMMLPTPSGVSGTSISEVQNKWHLVRCAFYTETVPCEGRSDTSNIGVCEEEFTVENQYGARLVVSREELAGYIQ